MFIKEKNDEATRLAIPVSPVETTNDTYYEKPKILLEQKVMEIHKTWWKIRFQWLGIA